MAAKPAKQTARAAAKQTDAVAKQTKDSEPEQVDAYMARLKHPMAEVVAAVRKIMLAADAAIGEEIKWNAPAFFYTGKMAPFDPKEYRRHLVIFNLFKKDSLRLVFWQGGRVNDKSGFLEGDYADGRRLAYINSLDEAKAKKKLLQEIVKKQIKAMDKT